MSLLTGTNIIAPVIPGDSDDSFPTHIDIYGKGGYLSVSGINERDNINADRRSPGMMVYTREDRKFWSLETGLLNWIELPLTGFSPRIDGFNIFYTVDDQSLVSGVKSFKNYNDTKFYGGFIADSGLFSDFSVQGGEFWFASSRPYNRRSGRFWPTRTGLSTSGRRPKKPKERSGINDELGEDPDDPESGYLFFMKVSKSGITRGYIKKTGEKDIIEFPDSDREDGASGGGGGGGGSRNGSDEDEDEDFDDELDDKEKKRPGEGSEDRPPESPDIVGGDGGDSDGGAGGGLPPGGGDAGGGAGGKGNVEMIFSSNAPVLQFRDHHASKIRNIRVVEKGSNWPTGLNLEWGPDPGALFPGEQYIARYQLLTGTGIFDKNSGIVGNDLRAFRTSGIYNVTSNLIWTLDWSGKIGGFQSYYDIDPWSGQANTYVYPVSKRYWGTSAKETLTADEITGLLSGEYAFDPRQMGLSKKTFIPTGRYIYFAWPANSGFNNIDFFYNYGVNKIEKKLNVVNFDIGDRGFVKDGYRFIFDKREVYFNQTLVTGVKNSVNYAEDYYLFRNRWILNGDLQISIKVKRRDEQILDTK